MQGINEAIEEQIPDSTIVSVQKGTDSAETMTLVENIVQANPNVQLFICNLDEIVAADALQSLGYDREDVCLIGATGSDDAMALVKQGSVLRGTLFTDIYTTGYNLGNALVQMLNGETPDEVKLISEMVTIDNVDQYID